VLEMATPHLSTADTFLSHCAQQFTCGRTDDHLPPLHVPWSRIGDPLSGTIFTLNEWWRIENRSGNEGRGPARRLGKNRRGGALDSNYVVARWTHAERPEELEFRAHRDDVTPLDGLV
jgi:hypothetical protein